MVISVTQRNEIFYLVVGMFNAAPGAKYLSEFSNAITAGSSVAGLAEVLTATATFKGLYPDYQSSTEFATSFVNNVLGSTVTDANKNTAIAQIASELDAGSSKAQVIVKALTTLAAVDPANADWGAAKTAYANKVDVAEWFSIEKAVESESLAELQAILADVTEDPATVTAAKNDGNLPGMAASFSVNLDALEGGSGSDQFSGVISSTATIQVGDTLDGAGSYDTLNVVAITAGLDTAITSVLNIEEVIITESSATDKTHNLATISTLEKLTINTAAATGQTTTIEGVATSIDFSINGQDGGDLVINYSDAGQTGAQTAQLLLSASDGGDLTAAGIERVELTTTGTTTVTSNFTFDAATYISITGTTNLTSTISTAAADATLVLDGSGKIILGTLDDDIDTLTGTGNTGGVEFTLDSDKNTQVSLGTGDDKVTTAASYAAIATDTAVIAAGGGSDTLIVKDSTHLSTAGHFTGFEKMILENGVSVDLDNITGITSVEITDAAGSSGVSDLTSTAAANITLRAATGELVLGVKGATTLNQIDTVSITIDDGTAGVTDIVTIATLKMIGVEILEILANDGANITFSEAENAGLNSVNLSGAGDTTLVTGDLATAIMALDANTATGDITVDASAFAGNTLAITAGSGTNTLTGGASIDTIIGGTGIDTITGGAANDALTGGAGVDTYIMNTAATNGIDTIVMDTVNGSDVSGDIFDFSANSVFIGTTTEDILVVADADLTAGTEAAGAAGDNIMILTGDFYADAAALAAAAFDTSLSGLDTGDTLVIYSSSDTADARIAVATWDAAGDITAATDSIILTGVTVAEAASGFGNTDFILD